MRKLTYLSTGLTLGGAELQLAHLAKGMAARGWDVDVVSMLPPQALEEELRAAGVDVRTLGMTPFPNPLAIFRLARMLKQSGTEILHSHMAKANFLGRIASRIAKTPVQISSAHNIKEGGKWVDWAYRLTDSMTHLTTNVSRRAMERYIEVRAVPSDRIQVMYNGIDVSRFGPGVTVTEDLRREVVREGAFNWIAVGRLAPGKDYPNMLKAFRTVVDQRPEAHLAIVGRGPLEEEVKALVTELGLSGSVTLLGERSDVPAVMKVADGFVMSSAWEGAPLVLLEAGASELPVVTTDVGGNAELVRDGLTGLVVQPHRPDELAKAMLHVMGMDETERIKMGEAGRDNVTSHFSMTAILDRWERCYSRLIEEHAATI